jgi:hypothetical protein
VVDVTTAPIGQMAPKGSAIRGTFQCTAVPRFGKDDDGDFSVLSGTFDIQNGSFNVDVL